MTDISERRRGGVGGRNRRPARQRCAGQWGGSQDEQHSYMREETKDEEGEREQRSQDYSGRRGSGGQCHGTSENGDACRCGLRCRWSDRSGTQGDVAGQSRQTVWLFVRNLPSRIGTSALKCVFSRYGKVRKIHLMQGRSVDDRSCAFVQYLSSCEAALAVQMLHGVYEMRPGLGPVAVQINAPGVFVENLSADVRQELLAYVFSFYGKVQTVHVAMGHSLAGRARAFVEYSSESEAQAASSALYQIRCDGDTILHPDSLVAMGVDKTSSSAGRAKTSAASMADAVQGMTCVACQGLTCVICLASPQTHAFVPCGHRCVCSECGEVTMELLGAACPICRAEAERVLQIFC
eukprot:TRINITY_DN11448_c0_g1_i1.p1 TRINITY_DN11448_c0_g1~~TRINITY_DN11448_c0_g1_i1.p1  ORF type:complete len:350 (-),score=43.42 TRINITY_DN11448_c0_g1_i1:175-1224(-)